MYNLLFWQGGLINLEKRRRVSGTSLSHLKYIPFFILIFHSRHKQRCTDNVLSALHACVVGCVPRVCTVKVNRAGWTYWYLFFFLEHDMCIYLQGTFYNSFVTVQSLALLLFGRLCIHRGIRTACSLCVALFMDRRFSLSLSAGVWGPVTNPCAAGVLFAVQPAPSPQSRCLAAGIHAAHWPGEVRWRKVFVFPPV